MGFIKFILSRIAGRVPSVNQMDTSTLSWNERDGILYGLKTNASGVKSIVAINSLSAVGPNGPETVSEILQGAVDGVNRVFATSAPYLSGNINVYLNGLKEIHFTESSDMTITLEDPPKNTGFTDRIESVFTLKT
ncbi:MAG: hypothetical protein AB9834_09955 [Lentimicrobium sp.]